MLVDKLDVVQPTPTPAPSGAIFTVLWLGDFGEDKSSVTCAEVGRAANNSYGMRQAGRKSHPGLSWRWWPLSVYLSP